MIQGVSEVVFSVPVPVAAGAMERKLSMAKPATTGGPKIDRIIYDTDLGLLTVFVHDNLPRIYPSSCILMMVPAPQDPEPKHKR